MKQGTFFRTTAVGAALFVTVVLSIAQAQDYNDGLVAASEGDYTTAVIKWQPLALQGDAMAQFNLALMYPVVFIFVVKDSVSVNELSRIFAR